MRKKPSNVSRMDYRSTRGWLVRIRRKGVLVGNKFFADRRYGGKYRAKQEAARYRDRILNHLPAVHRDAQQYPTRNKLQTTIRRNNKSGMPGVWKEIHVREYCCKNGDVHIYVYSYWCGGWRHDGRQYTRWFSTKRFGNREARKLAIECREGTKNDQTNDS